MIREDRSILGWGAFAVAIAALCLALFGLRDDNTASGESASAGGGATVIDIEPDKLPAPASVAVWTSAQYTSALRHDPSNPAYNPSFRQLLHVGFKIAAKMGPRYIDLLEANQAVIAKNVTENLYTRHIAPVFLGSRR